MLNDKQRDAVHDRDFLMLDLLLGDAPRVIDVGANAGQSILSLKAVRSKAAIDSFEPNPIFHTRLEALASAVGDVVIHRCGLGASEGECIFYTPVVDGRPRLEETSMYMEEFEKPWIKRRLAASGTVISFCDFRAAVTTGDSFNFTCDVIKIDVEGAERDVIMGFTSTIARCEPVLLVENSDWQRVTRVLERWEYRACMPSEDFGRFVKFQGERTNTFYLPKRLHCLVKS